MFNQSNREKKEFFSNPPLHDLPVIVPDEQDGVIVNRVQYRPQSNRPVYDGVHFSKETMGLQAKLNLGINLQPVQPPQLVNDPNLLAQKAATMERNIVTRLSELEEQEPSSNPVNE